MSKRPKYFTPNEVSIHNTAKDIWVSFLGKVYDLTQFIETNSGNSIQPNLLISLNLIIIILN
jgi:cytochrome b involved in lipid metabolism